MNHYRAAVANLTHADPILARVIAQIGDCTWQAAPPQEPYEALIRAVAHQQLHGKAAAAILARFEVLFAHEFPAPARLLAMSPEQLRACGFSCSKITALQDIAQQTVAGIVPNRATIITMPDAEIITRLTTLRGVGRWTVEMLLMFQLGRMDILPVDDYGVRNGWRIAANLPTLPTPKALRTHGTRWQPYRTIASWYLWRLADMSKVP